MKTTSRTRILGGMLLLALIVPGAGCIGSAGSSSDSTTATETTTAFPSGLAVASPFATEASSAVTLSAGSVAALSSSSSVTKYSWATEQIELILAGGSSTDCLFDPEIFLHTDSDADCYGPTVDYVDHPEYAGDPLPAPQEDGQLPIGDVGIWMETSPSTGDACAASELNARMEGVSDKSLAALMGLASLVCTANKNGIALPSNATQDLTAEMNALGITDTTFSAASISHSNASGSDEWSYDIDLEYSPSATHRIVVAMTHIPGASAGEFRGRLTYRVNDTMAIGGNCPTADITSNGSLLYDSAAVDDMNIEVRQAQFCGHDADGTTDGLVDPTDKYDFSNTDGWGNSFSILTADFDPQTLLGDFAYSWQAGPMDGNTRVFNVHTEAASSGSIPDGQAFFGYGGDIESTDGGIGGFICNWAGPGSSHTLVNYAQSQEVSFDGGSGLYQSVAASIGYAPTTSCEYDGTGAFSYDTDADGLVDTGPATPITNDLVTLTDADVDGDFDEIEAGGFSLPAAPANL